MARTGGEPNAAETDKRWIENVPSAGGRAIDRVELWDHRELVRFLAGRDLKVRYKQAVLGVSWAVLRPVIGAITLTVVFHRVVGVPSDGIAYVPFALVGYSAWSYFSASIGGASTSLIANSALITKVYFPRLLAPVAAVIPGLVDLAVAAIPLAIAMIWYGIVPGPEILTLPLWILGLVLAAFGAGLWFATLNVRYRDAGALLSVALQLLLFLSPIAYPASEVPHNWQYLYFLNPMAGLLSGLRWSLLDGPWPGAPLAVSIAVIALTLWFGLRYFQSEERRFADVI